MKRTTLSQTTASSPAIAAALAPTGHPHPLLTEQAREHAEPSSSPRTWAYTRRGDNAQVTVTCPSWCELDHRADLERPIDPADVYHHAYGTGATLAAFENGEDGEYGELELMAPQLAVHPNADDDDQQVSNVPYVIVELVEGVWSRPMGPDGLADFIGTVAGQLEQLRAMHARLVQARAKAAA